MQGGGRVLSIQSHTVQGYVGNKAAVFPLQLLGFDVDPINSVQFSNHTGYPTWKGQILDGEQLWALIEGLEANGLLFYTHLLTGYIGSLSFLETVLRVVEKLRSVNPDLIYVCDPVMGDDGRLYIRPELVPIYRHKVVPVATLITPNQFEAEQLTGLSIRTQADAITACDMLHAAGPTKVVITSMEVDGRLVVVGSDASCNDLDESGSKSPALKRFCIAVPKIPKYFTGTGDLMTALLLGWSHKFPRDLARAAELAIASLQAVLARTLDDYSLSPIETSFSSNSMRLELKLVQSRDDIINPPVVLRAQEIASGADTLPDGVDTLLGSRVDSFGNTSK
ncbi:hypothetical protein CLOM_g9837 [Closterium sp. NIES-68]|nr:hypothetical protein CLOM_g9837 [Closterium sp. NIES-68]GJP65536.1 hypothetical protein CLOP_g22416 [Closterium sp. NIES-67]